MSFPHPYLSVASPITTLHPYIHTFFLFICMGSICLIVSESLTSGYSNSPPARRQRKILLDFGVYPQKLYWHIRCLSSSSLNQSATTFVLIDRHACPNQRRVLFLGSALSDPLLHFLLLMTLP